jgi:hypothetical protein
MQSLKPAKPAIQRLFCDIGAESTAQKKLPEAIRAGIK